MLSAKLDGNNGGAVKFCNMQLDDVCWAVLPNNQPVAASVSPVHWYFWSSEISTMDVSRQKRKVCRD